MDSYFERMKAEYSEKLVQMSKKNQSFENSIEIETIQEDISFENEIPEISSEIIFEENPTEHTEISQDSTNQEVGPMAETEIVMEEAVEVFAPIPEEITRRRFELETEIMDISDEEVEEDMGQAFFVAEVFTGGQAFPVKNAKVVIKRDGNIIAFLFTDDVGKTDRIEVIAPPERNSLDPFSDDKSLEYTADIFAEGFIPKKDMLIEAVGGTNIILKTNMVPKPERVV